MNTNDYFNYFDELDDLDLNERGKPRHPIRNPKKQAHSEQAFVKAQDDSRASFRFTYKAARFEEWWLLDSLGELYEHQWISDVLRRVKGGKEASVYQCRAGSEVHADLVAAKVYRPRSLRNLKNDGLYRTGRIDLNEDGNALFKDADVHAMEKRTTYGEELRHTSWIAYEFTTLQLLHHAGADVPAAYAMTKNAILMDFIGDGVESAPALSEISLERSEARRLFDRVVQNIEILLANNRIHGDLSAYNILYWDGDIVLIDFPQVVPPEDNPMAWHIFLRDVTRVCDYFAKQGYHANSRKLAEQLWTALGHKIVPDVHPLHLDADNPVDRKIWNRQRRR